MNTKVFLSLVIGMIMLIIAGLVFLLQRQIGNVNPKPTDLESLTLPSDSGNSLPEDALAQDEARGSSPASSQESQKMVSNSRPPTMDINPNAQYEATLTTSEGDITIAFTTKETPITVNNFITLAKDGFYDNTIFHRVIEGFMIQGGDPQGNGTGGPGYKFDDEPFTGSYTRGTVAMANAGKNTNGSQFFIMHKDSESLPKDYVIFGHVTQGMDVVDTIATADVKQGPSGEKSTPVSPVKIISVKISEK